MGPRTAERCQELSQGYAFFAYPWKESGIISAPRRAILDTLQGAILGLVCIPVVRAKNVRVRPAKLLTRLRRG
jgi:hypothetical protein